MKTTYFQTLMFSLLVLVSTQGCNKKINSGSDTDTVNNDSISAFEYTYSNGTVSPEYHIQQIYKVDFQKKIFNYSEKNGAQVVTSDPITGVRALTEIEFSELKSLVSNLKPHYYVCPAVMEPVGGETKELKIFNTNIEDLNFSIGGKCTDEISIEESETLIHYLINMTYQ